MAASAAMVLSSCSNEIEQVSNLDCNKKEITVTTYTPGMTRAYEASVDTLQHDGFWLYAVSGEDELFNDQFIYDSDSWTPAAWDAETEVWKVNADKKVYWPTNSVSFYGVYSPSSSPESPLSISEEGRVGVGIYLSTMAKDQKDIMVATKTTNLSDNGSSNVALEFKHIMAEVVVQVKAASTTDYVTNLYGISITGKESSTYDIASNEHVMGESNAKFVIKNQAITGNWETGEDMFDSYQYDEDHPDNTIDELTEEYKTYGTAAMLLPGECTLHMGYVITLGDVQVSYETDKTATINLVAGKKNIIQVTLNPGQVPMGITASVSEWDPEEEAVEENM